MATISENLQILANSTADIKQAIIDKGGTINGDITTWASAISGIETGGGSGGITPIILRGTKSTRISEITYEGTLHNLESLKESSAYALVAAYYSMGTLKHGLASFFATEGAYVSVTVDVDEPIGSSARAGLFIISNDVQYMPSVVFEQI